MNVNGTNGLERPVGGLVVAASRIGRRLHRWAAGAALLGAVLLNGAVVNAQSASYTVFGSPCVPFLAFPYFIPQGVPKLGSTMQVRVASSTPQTLSFMVTGGSRTQWGGLTLPTQLAVPGFQPSCGLLLTSIDLVIRAPTRPSVEPVAIPFVIPNDTTLVGLSYYQQCMVFSSDPLSSFVSLSVAGHAVIGN